MRVQLIVNNLFWRKVKHLLVLDGHMLTNLFRELNFLANFHVGLKILQFLWLC